MSNIPMLGQKPPGNSSPGSSIIGSRGGQSVFPDGSASVPGAENRGDREWFSSVWKSLQKDSQENHSSSEEGKKALKRSSDGASGNNSEIVPDNKFPGQGAMMQLDGRPVPGNFHALQAARMMKGDGVDMEDEGAEDGIGSGNDDITSDTAQENSVIGEKAAVLFERIKEYSESFKTGTDGVDEDSDGESDSKLPSGAPGINASIVSGNNGDVLADEETEDGEEHRSAAQKLKEIAQNHFPGQSVSTGGKNSGVNGANDKESVENKASTIGIGPGIKAGAEGGQEIKTNGEADNKKSVESGQNKPVAENKPIQNLPFSGIGASASGEQAGNGTTAKVAEMDRKNGDLPRISVAEEEGLKSKAGESRQSDGTHQSFRYASMTREFAQRLEQIVKGSPGSSELQSSDKKGERKPEISSERNTGGKNIEVQSADLSTRLQVARYEKHIKAFAERSSSTDLIRIPVIAGSDSGANNQMQAQSAVKPVPGGYFDDSASASDEEFEWKKYVVMQSSTGEYEEEEQNDEFTSISRLNHHPISNGDLRRDVMPALARFVQSAQESDRSKQSNWQNHRFTMDDGKNLKISVREVEGVMQLKLGTSSLELARLLQQHHQEIREHLEKECNIEIDFQLDSKNMDEFAEFFGESSPQNGSQREETSLHERTEPLRVEKVVPQSVRSFGYNQMEWTA